MVLFRSTCARCGVTLTAFEVAPIASFLWQRGRCRHCGKAFGSFHLAVELAATGVALRAILGETDPDRLWANCLLGWTLLALAWIDWRWMALPDVLTLPLLAAGLLLTLLLRPEAVADHAAAAAIGYLGLRGVAWSYRLARGREGIGAADAKLLGAAGACFGLALLALVVPFAALLGLARAGVLALAGRSLRATTALPFGPCLALASWQVLLHGAWLANIGGISWSG
jgi:leader peptidase (prepilin peptidase)/N-methyltransferase